MATKEFSELTSKTTIDSADSVILSNVSGTTRITKANFDTYMMGVMNTGQEYAGSFASNSWYRIAKISSASASFMGLLLLSTSYSNKVPVPAAMLIGGSFTGSAVGCSYLGFKSTRPSGGGARPSFKAGRFVNNSAGLFFEVQIDTTEARIYASLQSANYTILQLCTPTLSTASGSEVIATFDFTE